MNKQRRSTIEKLLSELETLRGRIDDIKNEEQEYFDNVPENLQETDRYQNSETAVDELDSAFNAIEDAINSLTNIVENC